nr:cytochrome b [Saemundssonia lari]
MTSHSSKVLFLSVKGSLGNLPSPSSLSYFWNFGSLLGICLITQIVSGVFLSFHYSSSIAEAFESVSLLDEVWLGWLMRFIHANGASLFFIFAYLHIARGLFYGSYALKSTWLVGVAILLSLMGTAFLGYVLPWGQMSFWGATVITNLLSSFPYGESLVQWIWGGFGVGGPTLTRFFSLHFILPFFILALVLGHMVFLHTSGSNNPLGLELDSDKIFFHPSFTWKDLIGMIVFFGVMVMIVTIVPDLWMDPDNFQPANPLSTPAHIQPEWYFLFAYAILRSVPNKLGGVLALILSVSSLAVLPFLSSGKAKRFSPFGMVSFWCFCGSFVLLTLLGALPAEGVFVVFSQGVSVIYFMSLFSLTL